MQTGSRSLMCCRQTDAAAVSETDLPTTATRLSLSMRQASSEEVSHPSGGHDYSAQHSVKGAAGDNPGTYCELSLLPTTLLKCVLLCRG